MAKKRDLQQRFMFKSISVENNFAHTATLTFTHPEPSLSYMFTEIGLITSSEANSYVEEF